MNNKKIEYLISLYCDMFSPESLNDQEIKIIEDVLKVKLPIDFKKISRVYCGGFLGLHSIFTFNPDLEGDYDIVCKTLFYRSNDLKLPHRYVALLETEVSFIVMETQADENMDAKVIECSIEDAYNLAAEEPLLYNPVIFPSFTDFFEYLIEEEEKERSSAV